MRKPGKTRLDQALMARGLCESREQARRLILAGEVVVNDRLVDKPATPVSDGDRLDLKVKPRFVSRGGLKLEGALLTFGVDPEGWICLDIGASTGGFTDCLLQSGAARVHAFDVGTNQLAWKLRNDARVVSREKFNVRHLQPSDVNEPIDLAVFDVSFISLTLVLPPVFRLLHPQRGQIICLIKPQFELGREDVGKGGIVRDPALHLRAVEKIRLFIEEHTLLRWRAVMESPVKGTDGNTEFLAWITQPPVDH
ncbi:MAG: TlyA family RNA methyltransferase [Verrucomicrobiales bacterium]|nr:TlyA family RNA methyltransferase [Verrucomicrobiales bacterium]